MLQCCAHRTNLKLNYSKFTQTVNTAADVVYYFVGKNVVVGERDADLIKRKILVTLLYI